MEPRVYRFPEKEVIGRKYALLFLGLALAGILMAGLGNPSSTVPALCVSLVLAAYVILCRATQWFEVIYETNDVEVLQRVGKKVAVLAYGDIEAASVIVGQDGRPSILLIAGPNRQSTYLVNGELIGFEDLAEVVRGKIGDRFIDEAAEDAFHRI